VLQRDDLHQSDQLLREDLHQNVVHQKEDQLQEKQREQLQKDEDKILNRLSLLVGDNL
jgi:3-oxoacyl-[acyl-carrier-protein] synthase III